MGIFDLNKAHGLLNANLPSERIDPDNSLIKEALETLNGQTYDSMERMLYSYFGSVENAEKYGKDYILEYTTSDIETSVSEFNEDVRVRMTTQYRLRLKTKEELEADGQV